MRREDDEYAVDRWTLNDLLKGKAIAVGARISQNVNGISCAGRVRQELLEHRVVMAAGPSLENAEVLSNDESLGVDLVLSGVVFDYQDAVGIPKVDFSVTMIEKESRRVVWSSRSHSTGEDGVLFFNLGMVHTAHQLASEMARGTSEALNQ